MSHRSLRIITLLTVAALFTGTAHAETPVKADYALYGSGLHLLDIKSTLGIYDDAYDISMAARTYGMLERFAPWRGTLSSKGQITDSPVPKTYTFDSVWKGDSEITDFIYDNDGNLLKEIVTENGRIKEEKTPDPELAKDTIDMFSTMIVPVLALEKTDSCESIVPAFDGKRSFNLKFTDAKKDNISSSKYSVYEGDAIACDVEVEPLKGKWHDKPRGWMSVQEQAKGKGKLPRMWFAKPEGIDHYIPVRVVIHTNYGAMVMHLTNIDHATTTQ